MYTQSINNKQAFFAERARTLLNWDTPFNTVISGDFSFGDARWFEDGKLNACYNCIDRHAAGPDGSLRRALLYQAEDGSVESYTYQEVLKEVCAVANVLRKMVSKGECVAIYMPTCPEAAFTILACARIGVVHNVVFGGFSAESLRLRMLDSGAKVVVTVGEVARGGKSIDFLKIVKEAVGENNIEILVMGDSNTNGKEDINNQLIVNEHPRITYFNQLKKDYTFLPCVPVESEHRLFYLYTSGSTGRPKGVFHTTGGYLLYALLTTRYCFDIRQGDVFFCTADFGWITGHTYTLYGPLLNGVTTVLFGGAPLSPPDRVLRAVAALKATQFYTAPTLIRMLMRALPVNERVSGNLRVIGSVGEPLNEDAYLWYRKVFGNDTLPLIDTYWQTEAGGVMISPIPGVFSGVPECTGVPFLGMRPMIVDSEGRPTSGLGRLVFEGPWPGMARGIINDQQRFINSYFKVVRGCYFTGDEGITKDGLFWVQGRADDVINVSAHRLSTAEIEGATCGSELVAEAAVVSVPDEITGQAIVLFIVPSEGFLKSSDISSSEDPIDNKEIEKSVRAHLRKKIGPIVNPKRVFVVKELPKTRTGKLMRRILRCVLNGEEIGDLSTCINSGSVEDIRMLVSK